MDGMVLTGRIPVKFQGNRGGDGPMTLGQHNTIQWTGKLLTDHFLAMEDWVFQIPGSARIDDVTAAWSVLIARHESLRTTYPPVTGPDGWPIQRVAESGELTISVYEADAAADVAALARDLTAELRSRPFQRDQELPVRVAVAATGPRIRTVVAVYSHMAVDFAAMVMLGRQFEELAADPASRVVGPMAHQPLDQAQAERSPRGQRRGEATLRYWEQRIRRGPQCMFALPQPGSTGPGEARACGLTSPAAASALRHIAGRTGASPATVTLAAVTAVLTYRTSNPSCMLVSLASNRVEVRMRDYICTVSQYCLMLIDAGAATFDDLVGRVGTESMRATTHAMFNADELEAVHQAVNRSRGTSFDQDFVFNNLSVYGVNPREWGLEATGTQAAGDSARDGENPLRWWEPPWLPPALVQINVFEIEPVLELVVVCGDTQRVPEAEMALLLRGTERLLLAAAAADGSVADLAAGIGLEPVTRDGDWSYIDSCWVDLPAAQRLAETALPGATPRVFAVPGPDGTPVLTAYLAATEDVRTPGQAHTACMRVLPGRHTVMAPGRYVVCAAAPADPEDLSAWQREPVLSDGDGRSDDAEHRVSARA